MSMSDLNQDSRPLIHVHVCTACGGAFRREAFEGRMHTTGIFQCPSCGTQGPLNLEIWSFSQIQVDLKPGD